MFRSLYNTMMDLSARRGAARVLALVAFVESSVFPIPPDVFLIPFVLAQRHKAWFYATIATVASVAGGLAGWAIGYFLFDLVGQRILDFYGAQDAFHAFQESYSAWGFWIVFAAGFTPFPYKVVTIASGVMGLSVPLFLAGSILSRGARFFLVAGLLYWWGAPIRRFIEKYLGVLTIGFFVLLLGGFVALKYML